MCGIAGWVGSTPDASAEVIARAGAVLRHRGPDSEGAVSGDGFALVFRRLAILDLSRAGDQPMRTGDGRFLLVMNGEIYNYVELREELRRRGVTFRGGSDAEVLLQLLALDGTSALRRCNGMFAFAFVDLQMRRFVLGRDRLGVKPLYYSQLPTGRLQFGSELKAVLSAPDVSRKLDERAVASYLALGVVPGDQCAFSSCRKLPPGCMLVGELDQPARARLERWWSLQIANDEPARLDELEALLTTAVRLRLRSDVPVGVFLSSGIDSGLVAVLAARTARAEGAGLPTALTVGFDVDVDDYDESRLAAATASLAGLPHQVVLQQQAALDDLDRLCWHFDEPFADSSAIPSLQLAETARQHATVWLSGDGGDEAFGGYRRYLQAQRYRALQLLPSGAGKAARRAASYLPEVSALRYRLVKASAPYGAVAAAFDAMPEDPVLRHLAGEALRPHLTDVAEHLWQQWRSTAHHPLLARQQALDYAGYLPDDILVKVDRASMAHSVEVRSPFLDVHVVEWAARLRRDALTSRGKGKLPLRALAAGLLPPAVLSAAKRGFEPPVDSWLRSPAGQQLVRQRLVAAEGEGYGLWDPRAVAALAAAHAQGGGRPFGTLLWRLLVLESWHRQYCRQNLGHATAQARGGQQQAPCSA